ncbi:hypothetical protein R3P38DRAFT_2827934 [Favolaschia claudopus]|uniref:PPPDE domain-containing protein n=1 Tax=Favolaschia claudopus TaxID=2862362 RepID=A0AAW0EJX4_9AGAR
MNFIKNKKSPALPGIPSIPKLPSSPTLASVRDKVTRTLSSDADEEAQSPPSLSKLPSFPSAQSITGSVTDAHAKLTRSMSSLISPSEGDSSAPLEAVYIVLRPLKLREAPQSYLQRLGKVVKAIEFENYLILQHWGVLIANKYYHLHIDDKTKQISVSMQPFVTAHAERHTIKFPIWRTRMTHDERVGVAVGIIKTMGNIELESEVEITDEHGALVTAAEDRQRYKMEGRYFRSPIAQIRLFRGKYNALANNCIHFTRHFVFEQVLVRTDALSFGGTIQWLVTKWAEMGCRRSPTELAKFLSGILGMSNPFSMTPDKGARLLIKLLSIFLNIDYNPALDQKLLDDSKSADEAVEEVSDTSVQDMEGASTDPTKLPIPEDPTASEQESDIAAAVAGIEIS